MLSKYTVKSGDERLDRMVNIWNPYQCMVTFNMSRSASYFETGIGRGMGFRDSNQDLLGFVHLVPARARERILDIAATQKPDGSAYHQYQPLTKRGNNDVGSGFNDDPLWLISGTAAYVKESGDFGILKETVPFDNDPKDAATALRAPEALVPPRPPEPRPARPAPHRPRGLERLPEPQLLLGDARASRSRRPATAPAAPPSRSSSPASSSTWPPTTPPSPRRWASPTRRRRRPRARGADGEDGPRARLGRRVVPARLRLLREEDRLQGVRGRPDPHRVAGLLRDGRDRRRLRPREEGPRLRAGPAGDGARHRAEPAGVQGVPRSSSARSARTRRATRRTPASSATTTRG